MKNACQKTVIVNSPWSMAYPGLYNTVTQVPIKPIAVPTGVITHVLQLLMKLLLYLRTYCTTAVPTILNACTIPTAVHYVIST